MQPKNRHFLRNLKMQTPLSWLRNDLQSEKKSSQDRKPIIWKKFSVLKKKSNTWKNKSRTLRLLQILRPSLSSVERLLIKSKKIMTNWAKSFLNKTRCKRVSSKAWKKNSLTTKKKIRSCKTSTTGTTKLFSRSEKPILNRLRR